MISVCGILGAFNIDSEVVVDTLKSLEMRGRDGIGVYYKNKNLYGVSRSVNTEIVASIVSNKEFLIANTRAVPTTEYMTGAGFDLKNQQPFENNRFVVVHNGIISNDMELRDEYDIVTESTVDTSIIPALFSKLGVVEALKKLKGSFSILCYDKQENKFYAGKNFTPLHYKITDNSFLFVSSQEMTSEKVENQKPYSCFEIDMNTMNVTSHSLLPELNKRVLVICSGGIDSTTTAYLYKYLGYEVGLIHFKYGQAAQEAELFAVKNIAKDLGAKLFVYDANSIFSLFKQDSKLLYQKEANPDEQMLDAESTNSYVPNRNAILAMVSAGIAEREHYNTLAYGGQQMDSVYPDNNPDFVSSVDNLLKYSLNWNTNVHFAAPLIHLIKHEIVALGKKIGVNYDYTCSCYYPTVENNKIVHCHKCGCCQFRDAAFEMVEKKEFVEDTDEYINKYVLPFI